MKKISEKEAQSQIKQGLEAMGWIVYRVNNTGIYDIKKKSYFFHGTKGISDLIAIKNSKMLFIECKSSIGKLRPEQREFLDLINSVHSVSGLSANCIEQILENI